MSKDYTFNPGDFVVYPARGVGRVSERRTAVIDGKEVECFTVQFEKDSKIMIPSDKAIHNGLRSVVSPAVMESVITTLQTKVKTKRQPWTKRSAEYKDKIRSGDPIALAQVMRELYRDPGLATQNYSEHQLYETACSRLAPEYAVVQQITQTEAIAQLEAILQKSDATETVVL